MVFVVSGCAYVVDDSIQNVRFETPGAQHAKCDVVVDGVKYVVSPPQKLNIFKSRKPLEVDCMAPGNRRKKIFIEPAIEKSTYGNIANVGAGAAVDYASGAMFRYPDVVHIDFTGAPIKDSALPAHDSPDLRRSDSYKFEEFLPAQPRLNSDSQEPKPVLLRRGQTEPSPPKDDPGAFSEPKVKKENKGDLKSIIDKLIPDINPAAPKKADQSPTPLFPGQ